ncbi:MAG: chalcone isomerase family protein [Deltaproteobacteria bacterium]|nr:chalcone isomerase family protein [Deltaproteobacteria bacterium]
MRFQTLSLLIPLLFAACGRMSSMQSSTTDIPSLQSGTGGGASEIKSLNLVGSPQMIPLNGYSIPVYPGLTVGTTETDYSLTLTGYGVMKKTVLIVTVDVYLAASYVTESQFPIHSDPLGRLESAPVKALQMTLVRDVSGDQLKAALADALSLNGSDPNDPKFVSLFSPLSNGLKAGDTTLTISYTKGGIDTVLSLTTSQSQAVQGSGLGMDIWKIWFGATDDDNSTALKNALIGS